MNALVFHLRMRIFEAMGNRDFKIKALILLMSMTMLALILVQGFWFTRAYDTREEQYAQKINLSLRLVADRMLHMQGDDSTQIPRIQQEATNSFYVPVNAHFELGTLDSLLRIAFLSHDLNVNYQYAMVEKGEEELALGNYVNLDSAEEGVVACATRAIAPVPFDFRVTFPEMSDHVLQSMGIWIFSSISMVAVLLIFALLLMFLLREKRLAKLKKNFINNLTHELKTPITNISIASEVLMVTGPEIREKKNQVYAGIIHQETQRLKALVDRVLQISVLESGKISLDKEEVDLNVLVREVIHVVTPRIEARKGSITCELEAKESTIFADRHHLLNTLYNLIDNADKYSPESPQIRISTSNGPNGVHIEVHDKGKGVSQEKQKLIFDKFYRAEDGDVQNERGFGLGLSYVQLILKAHQGRIGIRSHPGNGSIFTIFLPFDTGL